MTKFTKFTIKKDGYIDDAVKLISINNNRAVFILDKKKIIGVVSEGDILKALIYKKNLKTPVHKIMNKSFKFLNNKNLELAKKYFIKFSISIIPVVNTKMELKDIVTINDILK